MVEKYYNNKGEVGVVISRGYGAGWYSWNRDTQYGTDILFDKTLVEMILNKTKIEEIEKYVDTKYPRLLQWWYTRPFRCGIYARGFTLYSRRI